MRFLYLFLFILLGYVSSVSSATAQSVTLTKDFSLGSPFSEPDGRSELVKLDNSSFITLAKIKGSQSGKSDFALEKYDGQLNVVWKQLLSAESSEDYKDLYFNGRELVMLSVIHLPAEKKTKMLGYGYDTKDGKLLWKKELESYQVGDWETHPHKGRVKESFIDLVCEHVNQDFITPFEYKHNIHFSPDQSKFVSYVYNYGESNLTASLAIFDNQCNLISKSKVSIDNDYTNFGIYIDNAGKVYILNANNSGKVNMIQFDIETKDFSLLELPSTNFMKDDFHVQVVGNGELLIANSEVQNGKIFGTLLSKFNFKTQQVEYSNFAVFDQEFKSRILADRKNNKQMKGEEDWMDYDLTHFDLKTSGEVFIAFEKRALHGDGYPHIGKETFDKSHKIEFTGHVQAETLIMMSFNKEGDLNWKNYILKNQVYPANDGLNTISYAYDSSKEGELRLVYASSEGMEGTLHSINLVSINSKNGSIIKSTSLSNENKLTIVKDYSLFLDKDLVLVGKKGLLGKASMIVKYGL